MRRRRREPRPAGSVHHLGGAKAHATERHHRTHEALEASVARVLDVEEGGVVGGSTFIGADADGAVVGPGAAPAPERAHYKRQA